MRLLPVCIGLAVDLTGNPGEVEAYEGSEQASVRSHPFQLKNHGTSMVGTSCKVHTVAVHKDHRMMSAVIALPFCSRP